MKYVVIEEFTDLQDQRHKYVVGDQFPRNGYHASEARIEELLSNTNRRCRPMIRAIEEPQEETVSAVVVAEDPEEATSEAKEDVLTAQTDERPPKTPKAKKNAKKG